MSLIHDLMGYKPIKRVKLPRKVKEESSKYVPPFLDVIKRQSNFVMSEQTLKDEKLKCLQIEKIDFYTWLKEKNLKIKEMGGLFKIYC